jgi:hypothetical protein
MKEIESEDSPITPGKPEEFRSKKVNLPVPFKGPQRTVASTPSLIRPTLLACLVAGSAYWMLHSRAAEPKPPRELDAPGWSRLESCAETASIDGTKRLTLLANGGAFYEVVKPEGTGQEAITEGKWSFDAAPGRIRIEVGDVDRSYLVVKPIGLSGCILIAGELRSADLTASWFLFGVEDDDGSFDRDPPDHL